MAFTFDANNNLLVSAPAIGASSITIANFPVNGAGDIRVDASGTPITLTDLEGNPIGSLNGNLNVHLASQEILNLDASGNLGVNIQGSLPITVQVSQLPAPNAALETGGNLAADVANNQFNPQIVDLLKQILAQLQVLNMNFAASTNTPSLDDLDALTSSLIN